MLIEIVERLSKTELFKDLYIVGDVIIIDRKYRITCIRYIDIGSVTIDVRRMDGSTIKSFILEYNIGTDEIYEKILTTLVGDML